MSSRSRRARVSRFREDDDEDEANRLILKLQAFLPQHSDSSCNKKTSASKILKKTCDYIKKLQKEVDDLSDGLSQRLASGDIPISDAHIITTLKTLIN